MRAPLPSCRSHRPVGFDTTYATAVSADGSVVVGTAYDSTTRRSLAFRWTALTGAVLLPGDWIIDASSIPLSSVGACCVSADGNVIAGSGLDPFPASHIVRWKSGVLEVHDGGPCYRDFEQTESLSPDGSVVGGVQICETDAFPIWGITITWYLPGDSASGAIAISSSGDVIVGWSAQSNYAVYPQTQGPEGQAFRWTLSTGMVGLGTLPGTQASRANAVSADGSVIVGVSGDLYSQSSSAMPAELFVWTAKGGMQKLSNLLRANGVPAQALAGWNLAQNPGSDQTAQVSGVSAVSADGHWVVGSARGPDGKSAGFVANITVEPTVSSGGGRIDVVTLVTLAGVALLRMRRRHRTGPGLWLTA